MGNIFPSVILHIIKETLSERNVKGKQTNEKLKRPKELEEDTKKSSPLYETMKIPKNIKLISKIIPKV